MQNQPGLPEKDQEVLEKEIRDLGELIKYRESLVPRPYKKAAKDPRAVHMCSPAAMVRQRVLEDEVQMKCSGCGRVHLVPKEVLEGMERKEASDAA
jgi:hypothetical protein